MEMPLNFCNIKSIVSTRKEIDEMISDIISMLISFYRNPLIENIAMMINDV
ncbi:hypothetical protein [Epilithonimonas sp.]|uniref:hypothetical protein n=1 Tax=Epilithonimonas sp. TaxID=2894511 RepID=UPI00289B2100|nr:hypothetical protein [Epilithonimonas sp.]